MNETSPKSPFKKVLIALDYDNNALKIAETGYYVAKAMGAEVVLLHVLVDATYYDAAEYLPMMGAGGFSGTSFKTIAEENGLEKAAFTFLENVRNHLYDKEITLRVEKGDFADIILNREENHNADLIVVGSYKKDWFDRILTGNVAEKVFHETRVPLLIIPIRE